MHHTTAAALLLLAAGCAAARPSVGPLDPQDGVWKAPSRREVGFEAGDASRLTLLWGRGALDDSWDPVYRPTGLGIEVAYEPPDSGFGVEVGGLFTTDRDERPGEDVSISVHEVYAGIRRTLARRSRLQPYVGLGASIATAAFGSPDFEDLDEQTFGGYVHGGLVCFVTDWLSVGFDVRTLFWTDIDDDLVPGDVDYVHVAFALGFSF